MDDNIYKTPESEVIDDNNSEIRYAGFWIRVGSAFIDTILMLLIILPVLTMIYGTDYWLSEDMHSGVWDILLNYLFPAIAVILFWTYKSATPGKMILKLKIINVNTGEPITLGQSLGRYAGYYLAMIPLFIGLIWVAFDKRKQGWHDKIASTAVIYNSKE